MGTYGYVAPEAHCQVPDDITLLSEFLARSLSCLRSQSLGYCACLPLREVLRLDQYSEKVDLFGLGSSLYFAVSLASAGPLSAWSPEGALEISKRPPQL